MLMLQDPVLYRLYEVLVVYGMSYKALIQEKFGDGIMSAIGESASTFDLRSAGLGPVPRALADTCRCRLPHFA